MAPDWQPVIHSELVSRAAIWAARRRIAGGVVVTPRPKSISLSEITGALLLCKLDNRKRTGSFKERDAHNAFLQLPERQKKRVVIATSAGNQTLGLAYHSRLLCKPQPRPSLLKSSFLTAALTCQRLTRREG
ncbi:MAG: pyridoxal-phosphate dependent enzyme [Pirellulales bacterium]|nr:pyridoxal-phosphate dependent enzyme [Pirellulales bacterium]